MRFEINYTMNSTGIISRENRLWLHLDVVQPGTTSRQLCTVNACNSSAEEVML